MDDPCSSLDSVQTIESEISTSNSHRPNQRIFVLVVDHCVKPTIALFSYPIDSLIETHL